MANIYEIVKSCTRRPQFIYRFLQVKQRTTPRPDDAYYYYYLYSYDRYKSTLL